MSQSLQNLINQTADPAETPLASDIANNVVIYDCESLRPRLGNPDFEHTLKQELAAILLEGPGAFVFESAYLDTSIIDRATDAFMAIIEREKESQSGGDHFAKQGVNSRIWNSLQKLCATDPDLFAHYHSNRFIQIASEAWLGPGFQMTAQVNLVRPGGAAQEGHCDYHLGFMTKEQVTIYPDHVHAFSARLTLQGAIAHCDMPVESGTTKLLPFSQNWPENYTRFRDADVREIFEAHCVQLPLKKGDLIFFSPGLMHAAGDNKTETIHRLVNLLQVSSAFGRAMETIDRIKMCNQVYPSLLKAKQDGKLSPAEIDATIASTAEAYPFPTNLDQDPPVGGLAPKSQQDVLRQAVQEEWTVEKLVQHLKEQEKRRLA